MNRRRHFNIVPVAALIRWVVVAFFLGSAGLSYVYFKNQMQATGSEIHNLEAQIAALNTQDQSIRAQIDRLSSHGYLERRLAEGFIRLTPITDNRIVRVRPRGTASATDNNDRLQPVSNQVTQ